MDLWWEGVDDELSEQLRNSHLHIPKVWPSTFRKTTLDFINLELTLWALYILLVYDSQGELKDSRLSPIFVIFSFLQSFYFPLNVVHFMVHQLLHLAAVFLFLFLYTSKIPILCRCSLLALAVTTGSGLLWALYVYWVTIKAITVNLGETPAFELHSDEEESQDGDDNGPLARYYRDLQVQTQYRENCLTVNYPNISVAQSSPTRDIRRRPSLQTSTRNTVEVNANTSIIAPRCNPTALYFLSDGPGCLAMVTVSALILEGLAIWNVIEIVSAGGRLSWTTITHLIEPICSVSWFALLVRMRQTTAPKQRRILALFTIYQAIFISGNITTFLYHSTVSPLCFLHLGENGGMECMEMTRGLYYPFLLYLILDVVFSAMVTMDFLIVLGSLWNPKKITIFPPLLQYIMQNVALST